MKKIIAIFVFIFTSGAHAGELIIGGGASFNHTNIIGQSDAPSYQGNGLFGEVEYLIPFANKKAFSLFGIYQKNELENTNNDSTLQETLKVSYLGGGLKFYMGSAYLSASIGRVNFSDTATGTVEKEIKSSELGQEVGAGFRFRLTSSLGITFSIHALHASLNPSNGSGFYKDYDLWQYRGSVGLSFVIPSTSSLER